jgi:hypothetical protein
MNTTLKSVFTACVFFIIGCTPHTLTISGRVIAVGKSGLLCEETDITLQTGVTGQVYLTFIGSYEDSIKPLIGENVSLFYTHPRLSSFSNSGCPKTTLSITKE